MTDWVDMSVEVRALRRDVHAGRRQRSEVPWWVLAQTPPPGSGLCPDCGHQPHQPQGALNGRVCGHGDCWCRRVNGVDRRPHGRVA